MRIKKEVLNKIISIFASVFLLVNSFTPYSFAQVPTEEPTVTPTQEEITPAPTTEITPTEEISLTQTYQAPQNDKVTVTFTKLPETPGTLTIKVVKLTAEQMEELGAFSDT